MALFARSMKAARQLRYINCGAPQIRSKLPHVRTLAEKIDHHETNRKLMINANTLLHTFDTPLPTSKSHVAIKNCAFIASYNRCDSDESVIFVPGTPAKWTPPSLPHKLQNDNEETRINQNIDPGFSAFFKALLTMHPTFHMDDIELVTDQPSLRRLLWFISGKRHISRIDVDIVENTMFFTLLRPTYPGFEYECNSRTFQKADFSKAFFRFDSSVENSSAHHRIIRYNLGGIECLVHSKASGYFDNRQPDLESNSVKGTTQADFNLEIQEPVGNAGIKVIERGHLVDPSTILQFALRAGRRKINWNDVFQNLWLSQGQHHVIARHEYGLMTREPKHMDTRNPILDWEEKEQVRLRALVGLIWEIKRTVKTTPGGRCTLMVENEEEMVLKLYERDGEGSFLPDGIRERCWA